MTNGSWFSVVAVRKGLLALVAWALTGCGGGGGGYGGGGPPTTGALSIASSVTKAEPLQQFTLTPSSQAQTSANYKVEVDVSGTGTFAAANTVIVLGLFREGKIVVAAPVLEMARASSTAMVADSFAVRVRRGSDGAVSGPVKIAYDTLEIPPDRRGAATTMVDMVMKKIMAQSGGVLTTTAAKRQPGQLATASKVLGQQINTSDIQAEAILRQIFGFTTIDKAFPASATKRALSFKTDSRTLSFSDNVRTGMTNLFSCLSNQFDATGEYGQASATACDGLANTLVIDDILPSFGEVQSRMGGALGIMTGLVSRPLGLVGNYIERLAFQSELTQHLTTVSQITLRGVAAGANPGSVDDLGFDTISDLAKSKLYDKAFGDFEGIAKGALDLVNAEDALSSALLPDLSLDKIRQLESNLSGLTIDKQRLEDLAGEFGGQSDTPTSIPIGIGGSIPITGQTPTAASICAASPELDSQLMAAGLGSCESYLKPFLDPVFSKSTLGPIMSDLSDPALLAQLQACLNTPGTPTCMDLTARVIAAGERLNAAITAYQTKTYECDGGYTTYKNKYGSLTCVFGTLVAPVSGGACVPGSRDADFDTGESRVCVYYSRDYIQPNNTCRVNYGLVTFQGYETCRWLGLAPTRPAVYSVNTDTGDRATLVQ